MAEGAGAFVTRSFELMIKESSGKKFGALNKSLKDYLERSKIPPVIQSAHSVNISTSKIGEGVPSKAAEMKMVPTSPSSKAAMEATAKANVGLSTFEILSKAGLTLEEFQAEMVLLPLRLAFETKQAKFMEPALDCLHKLISYENLEGDAGLEGGKNGQTATVLFNMVCACADSNAPDSTALQVMKVILTAVSSNKFRVHGECLLSALRTCYNIVLTSKNPIYQATAKGTLTQMISISFKRMESETQSAEMSKGSSKDASKASFSDENGSNPQENHTMDLPEAESHPASLTVEELQHLAGNANIKGLEAALGQAVHPEGGKKIPEGLDLNRMTVAQRNALLIFRTLCKMCMKEETDDATNKKKILSLELLQGLLESVSHSFTQDSHFIDSVKAYLCYALLRACVSAISLIFQFATEIFSVLLLRFRDSLKAEIGVLFPLIILRSLDSSDTPLHQRIAILKLLERVCKDPQMLADVFVNYDCDPQAANLFQRTVSSLSRMAQGTLNADPSNIALAQNSSIKGSALQCLVNVLKSLVEWAKMQDLNREPSREGIEETGHGSVHEMISDGKSMLDTIEGQVDQFEKAKVRKSTLEVAVAEFNRKAEKGIEFLVTNKLVENNPTAIAHFLHSTPGLSKQMIGDYIGQFEEFPLAVMYAYVDAMNFKGMKFHVAIREFLKGFRLPGEAHKIDRIMEKFAERYCIENPGIFKSADAAYVLAYAVIMLNTDAHNPMVCPKMTKVDFVQMNSRAEPDEGVAEDLLSELYDSIVQEEITMKVEDRPSVKGSWQKPETAERSRLMKILNLGLAPRKSAADAKKECEEIVRRTQALFKGSEVKRGIFYMAKQMELVRPMLEAVGWPLLAAFSVTIEDSDNKIQVALCMEGFKLSIHLGKLLGMDTLRYALLTSLVRFTYLHSPKEMHSKNAEALRTLLNLSENEPDTLQDTWNAFLECISRLEYITSNLSITITLMQGSNHISRDALVQSLNELMGKPAEQVFVNTVKLPSDAIVEFFAALCGVSAEELKQNPPRVFSLQKLVEISYYNMARIRMVWANIWLVLSEHFISAGSHHDEKIAMYAIDSIRQLGIKYLERSELANFTFQNDILKPFVILIQTSRSSSVRALVVDCIIQMIKLRVESIKSGWKSVFMVFKAAALDEVESIVETAFENMEQVVLEHFNLVVVDCFMDCVDCVIAFANNKCTPRISLKSIALLRICENRLAEGMIPGGVSKPVELANDSDFDVAEHYWFPMLVGLSDLTSDLRTEVRNCALEVLFDLLIERGHKFSPSFWKNIFDDVLFPIFNHVREAGKNIENSAHTQLDLRETCINSLKLLCNLFSTFYSEVSFVLPSLLRLLLDCATRADQTLASISVGALTHLIEVGGHQFNEKDWSTLLESIRDVCYTTQPVELLNSSNLPDYSVMGSSSRKLATQTSPQHFNGEKTPEITVDDSEAYESHENGFSFGETLQAGSDHGSPVLGYQSDAWETESKETTIFSEGEGGNSSTVTATSESPRGGFFGSQTRGRKFMGNMMDTILLRNITLKQKPQYSEISTPTYSQQTSDYDQQEPLMRGDDSLIPPIVRSKCVVQLLFLGALDSLQRKHWNRLQIAHKIIIMDILLSMLDFAASYNSYTNLKIRLQQFFSERPPANLLRQEIEGTRIYLTVLLKCITKEEKVESLKVFGNGTTTTDDLNDLGEVCRTKEEKLYEIGEERMFSFCSHILKETADLQPRIGDAVEYDLHYALALRSPVVVKVLEGLHQMNTSAFRRHLPGLYPYFTKLICCEQVDVRRSLGDLFKGQLAVLLP